MKRKSKLETQREQVANHLRRHGPAHAADLWRGLRIPRGSIYRVLDDPRFRQLRDSRWELARGR